MAQFCHLYFMAFQNEILFEMSLLAFSVLKSKNKHILDLIQQQQQFSHEFIISKHMKLLKKET